MLKIDSLLPIVGLVTALVALPAFGAEQTPIPLWHTVMLIIVFLTLTSSAALSFAAWRQWRNGWRLVAAFPIALLVLWIGWIVGARTIDPESHTLWSFELFAWSLLNLLYMVTVLTAKRTFEKADQPS